MGNHASRRTSAAACKVILADGTAVELERGTPVAELMLEHPQQFVVEFNSLLGGAAKPTPLPADHKLEPERVYVMLPMKPGKPPTLSAGEVRQVLSRTRLVLRSGSFPSSSSSTTPSCWSGPLTKLGRPESGGLDGDGEDDGWKVKPAGKMDVVEFPSEGFGEVPEYLSKQLSGRLWKPTLHTIEERVPQRKLSHWLF